MIKKTTTAVGLGSGVSNFACVVGSRYFYKRFFSINQLHQEMAGIYLFNSLGCVGVPRLFRRGHNYLVTELITPSKTAYKAWQMGEVNLEQLRQAVAEFIAQAYLNYQLFGQDRLKSFPFLRWESKLARLTLNFSCAQEQLSKFLPGEELQGLSIALKNILRDLFFRQNLTITHRDLHLTNLLFTRRNSMSQIYVIDFEHCAEGPLELEFQNSLFWQDDKSLCVQKIRELLTTEYSIPYSIEREKKLGVVYLIDQLCLAAEKKDYKKVFLLAQNYQNQAHKQYYP